MAPTWCDMELPSSNRDDQRTSRKSCNASSSTNPAAQQRRLERMMLRLKAGLQRLPAAERRRALEQLSSPARQALLRFMTKDLFAAPRCGRPRSAEKGRTSSAVKVSVRPHRGVREVPTGLFQASISFRNFLVRSRTSRSFETALRFFAVLQRFRDLAAAGREPGNVALEAARLARAQTEACREAGISDDDLKPSYSASLSTQWAGKVESPATSSLQKALVWRQRLEAARGSWQQFRAAWLSVLQDERPGGSVAMKRGLAEARVDRATRPRRSGGRDADRYKAKCAAKILQIVQVKRATGEQKIRKVGIALQKFEKLMSKAESRKEREIPEQRDLKLLISQP